MAVVFVTLIARVPYIILNYLPQRIVEKMNADVFTAAGFMTYLQHFTSPLIYLIFWVDYRKAVWRACRQLTLLIAFTKKCHYHSLTTARTDPRGISATRKTNTFTNNFSTTTV
ncbi:hypothetical protein BV898_19540 [Hypsibius exemplaris]|uniref:Uncharacterized protein n=1 Tax=Hypsibius exemplaris TaxID=2072580 RepID=A0A9X6NLN4_HYPEX|nr:hypothetical protein BV898_19540 [Hypsibius exemplaris]